MKITGSTGLEELAALVCKAMDERGFRAVLVGGAVVSIWSNNAYQSHDLDFITTAETKRVDDVMVAIGFRRHGRHYEHPQLNWIVEFPSGPLAIGDEPITTWERKVTPAGTILLLAPTECVMDRLAAYFHWSDPQALDQAVLVSRAQAVNLRRVKAWAKKEGEAEKFEIFRQALSRDESA